jgi:hypothetical protein
MALPVCLAAFAARLQRSVLLLGIEPRYAMGCMYLSPRAHPVRWASTKPPPTKHTSAVQLPPSRMRNESNNCLLIRTIAVYLRTSYSTGLPCSEKVKPDTFQSMQHKPKRQRGLSGPQLTTKVTSAANLNDLLALQSHIPAMNLITVSATIKKLHTCYEPRAGEGMFATLLTCAEVLLSQAARSSTVLSYSDA